MFGISFRCCENGSNAGVGTAPRRGVVLEVWIVLTVVVRGYRDREMKLSAGPAAGSQPTCCEMIPGPDEALRPLGHIVRGSYSNKRS